MRAVIIVLALLVGALPAEARKRGHCALPEALIDALHTARQFGTVRIGSTCGGRHTRGSYHYRGQAVDFRMLSGVRAAVAHFRSWPGGMAHYGNGLLHLDTGPYRRWTRH